VSRSLWAAARAGDTSTRTRSDWVLAIDAPGSAVHVLSVEGVPTSVPVFPPTCWRNLQVQLQRLESSTKTGEQQVGSDLTSQRENTSSHTCSIRPPRSARHTRVPQQPPTHPTALTSGCTPPTASCVRVHAPLVCPATTGLAPVTQHSPQQQHHLVSRQDTQQLCSSTRLCVRGRPSRHTHTRHRPTDAGAARQAADASPAQPLRLRPPRS
jgi:hypothetical protein